MPARGRIRNKRGEYQSIDHIGLEHIQQSARGTSHTAGMTVRTHKKQEVFKAENRLRVIEQISKYREEKIKREFDKLEDELK